MKIYYEMNCSLEFQLDPQNICTLLVDKVGPIVDNVDGNCLE